METTYKRFNTNNPSQTVSTSVTFRDTRLEEVPIVDERGLLTPGRECGDLIPPQGVPKKTQMRRQVGHGDAVMGWAVESTARRGRIW